MDFRKAKRIGDEIDTDWDQLTMVQGYDHNWALDTEFGKLEKIAQVEDPKAGRAMEVYSDLPGVQFYAGNCITPQKGKGGALRRRREKAELLTISAARFAWRPSIFQTVSIRRDFGSRCLTRDSRIIRRQYINSDKKKVKRVAGAALFMNKKVRESAC